MEKIGQMNKKTEKWTTQPFFAEKGSNDKNDT